MARPKSDDPKVTIGLSLRRSTVDRLTTLAAPRSVGLMLSRAVEAKYGGDAGPPPRPAPAPKPDPGHDEVASRFKGKR